MTGFELIRQNKAEYTEMEERIKTMPDGFEKDVASTFMLNWIKGTNWRGGLDSNAEARAVRQITKLGYDIEKDYDRIDDELHRQMDEWEKEHGY